MVIILFARLVLALGVHMKTKMTRKGSVARFVTPGGVTAVIDESIPSAAIVELKRIFAQRVAKYDQRRRVSSRAVLS